MQNKMSQVSKQYSMSYWTNNRSFQRDESLHAINSTCTTQNMWKCTEKYKQTV